MTAPHVPFALLFADPAWAFGDALTMSEVARGASSQYATMSTDEIAALPVAGCIADDAVGVIWRPSSMAEDGNRVLRAWGFRPVGELVWYKLRAPPTETEIAEVIADGQAKGLPAARIAGKVVDLLGRPGFGMGRLTRAAKEVAVVGVRGSPYKHLANKSVRDVFLHPALPHSRKPEIVQDAFETMFPAAACLELFARRARPRWTCVGNESPHTLNQDIRDVVPAMARKIAAARAALAVTGG